MSEFQGAIGVAQTRKLKKFVSLRRKIAYQFSKAVNDCKFLLPQATSKEKKHSYWTYTVRIINNNIT